MQNNQRKGIMLILSSPSGAGKTSICKKVLETDKNLVMSVSYTTRPKRKSEKEMRNFFQNGSNLCENHFSANFIAFISKRFLFYNNVVIEEYLLHF